MVVQQTTLSPFESAYERIADNAAACGLSLTKPEIAKLAEGESFGEQGIGAIECVLAYAAKKRRETAIETIMRLSRLPRREPKTFENFDFTRIQGKDVDALKNLPMLSELHARKNILFIGPEGVGKTHLAQAYGYACCSAGYKTYYIKATELRDKLTKAIKSDNAARSVASLVKSACLIIDEMGRCRFDEQCTNLFFDIIDRRYEKEVPNTLIITSNAQVPTWNDFFSGKETLLCALDRIFDRAAVYMMDGASYRGSECETFSVKSAAQITKGYGRTC